MKTTNTYEWVDNPTLAGISKFDPDILNDCLMHLKYEQSGNDSAFSLFDTKLSERILSGADSVGWALQGSLVTQAYSSAVDKILEEYEKGIETTYRGISCNRAISGVYIADIIQKSAIEELYSNTGIANFYILDQENSQFYLPKNIFFEQLTDDSNKVNEFNEAGLPDHSHRIDGMPNFNSMPRGDDRTGCVSYSTTGTSRKASETTPIYGKSNTVQPPSSSKLLYYKVGNHIVNDENIDIGNLILGQQNKADKDLSNVVPDKNFICSSTSWVFPNYNAGVVKNSNFIADHFGILICLYNSRGAGSNVSVNGKTVAWGGTAGNDGEQYGSSTTFLSPEDSVTYGGDMNGFSSRVFYPARGPISNLDNQ